MQAIKAAAAVVLACLLLTGCNLSVHEATRLNSDGSCGCEIRIGAETPLQSLVPVDELLERAKDQGWQVTRSTEGSRMTVSLIQEFATPEKLTTAWNALVATLPAEFPKLPQPPVIHQRGDFFRTTYEITQVVPARAEAKTGLLEGLFRSATEKLTNVVLDATLDSQVEFVVPGTVSDSNADNQQGQRLGWLLTSTRLEKGTALRATSSVVHWDRIGFAGLLGISGLFALFAIVGRPRRRAAPQPA